MVINEVKNGSTTVNELVRFTIENSGHVVISTQNNDATAFAGLLMARRSIVGNADSDYVELKPDIVFNNNNNYQVLTPGEYAIKITTAADIIVAVTNE